MIRVILPIGLIILLGVILVDYHARHRPKPVIYYRKQLPGNYNARTVPPFGIFVRADQSTNKALLTHELVHWQQYQRRGLLRFYVDYIGGLMRYGYDGHPMEKEARTNESCHCQQHYTDCVRTGQAQTVQATTFRK